MTVSFFMKGSSSVAAGRFKALMYGLFIVLLYVVPIAVIILITRFAGGDAVTGAATVILAMGAGRTAAKAIDEYVRRKFAE